MKDFFKNTVTKNWLKAAGVRAVKTMAQTFVAAVGTATLISGIDWPAVLSTTVLAGVLSVATSLAGLPEVTE